MSEDRWPPVSASKNSSQEASSDHKYMYVYLSQQMASSILGIAPAVLTAILLRNKRELLAGGEFHEGFSKQGNDFVQQAFTAKNVSKRRITCTKTSSSIL